jgi:hypothetical protein
MDWKGYLGLHFPHREAGADIKGVVDLEEYRGT